jgi:hypothetical protein
MLFAIAAYLGLCLGQMDVRLAFLYGNLEEVVYSELPIHSYTTEFRKNNVVDCLRGSMVCDKHL